MSNLRALPVSGQCNSNQDVADYLRLMADQIEAGDRGDIRTCLMILEPIGDSLETYAAGKGGLDTARVMGLMFHALNTYMSGQPC